MQYEHIRLEKSMYQGPGGLSGHLEGLDPSAAYRGTALEGLDAYQRQLSRFDIRVRGADSSQVGKFWATGDAAALFPEYVARTVAQGAQEAGVLQEICASITNVEALDYRSISADIADADLSDTLGEGEAIPEAEIRLNETLVRLRKRGRMLCASYEALRFQRLDVVAVALARIGAHIARAQLQDAVKVLLDGSPEEVTWDERITYDDLLALWGAFDDFEMNVLLAAPDAMLQILAVEELRDPVRGIGFQNQGAMLTPFGARLIRSRAVPAGHVIALDRRYALEMVQAGGIQLEYDKLIDRQLERAAVTAICGFGKLFGGAVKVLREA